jgi:hypothetical protein
MSLEEENELRHFLKLVRPDWSLPHKNGSNIVRACEKLKAIGVHDVADLLHRVESNTINDDLYKAHKPRFSRETIQSIHKEAAFWQYANHVSEPSYRQIGLFAPVPQLLAGRNLRTEALKSRGANTGSLHPVTGSIPSQERLRSTGSSCGRISRPHTVNTAETSSKGYSEFSSEEDAERRRPISAALSMPYLPYSSLLDDATGDFVGDVLPRLRGVRPKHAARDSNQVDWKRTSIRSSSCCCTADPTSDDSDVGASLFEPSSGSVDSPLQHASTTDSQDEADAQKVERWNRAGTAMVRHPLNRGWSTLHSDSLLQHGEAMIREHNDLQHKKKLYQQIALEGRASPMRHYVAEKIATRLKEEEGCDEKVAWDVQQSCLSIKRHINGMSNARKNLSTLRHETQHALQPRLQPTCTTGLSLGCFHKIKLQCMHDMDDDARQPSKQKKRDSATSPEGF